MSVYEILAAIGVVAVLAVAIHILTMRDAIGNVALAAALSAFFGAFTAVTIYSEGVLPVWENHTQNLWGVQVWWDLLFAVGIALFFIVPRARKAGMAVPLWLLFVVSTASIGLLAMVARLFWLERQQETAAPAPATA